MRLLVGDNGDDGGRISSWQRKISDGQVSFATQIVAPPEQILDALVLHYSDFTNGTYRENEIYCLLQGLYHDQKDKFSNASSERCWQDFMIDFTNVNENWSSMWFEVGQKSKHTIFFTGGGDEQFTEDFKTVIRILQNMAVKVSYCYPVTVAQARVRQALSDGCITEKIILGVDPKIEYSLSLLRKFLPLDVELQLGDALKCREQAKLLIEEKNSISEIYNRIYAMKTTQPLQNLNSKAEVALKLKDRLMTLAGEAVTQGSSSLDLIFGYQVDEDGGIDKCDESDLSEGGFHRTFERLRDTLLIEE